MALVVLLRGVNVGGHRTFRPTTLVEQLKHLDAVNIGAAGTFVIRRPVPRAQLRAELARGLPFDTEVIICQGREIVGLLSRNPFEDQPVRADVVRFVSVLSQRPRAAPSTPIALPSSGKWLLKILGRDDRFIFGVYRRQMKAIGYLGALDRLFGAPATTRNWNTITAIARVLKKRADRPASKLNRGWHEANRMPRNASLPERLRWHQRHARVCGCRPIPKSLRPLASERRRARKSPTA